MSINQITNANTFGQLITAVSAMIAVANNLTDGPEVHSNSTWTFTNPGVGVNVGNTAIINTANVSLLNLSQANVTNETVGRSNISTANVTVANITGATITNLNTTDHATANANVSVLLQVSDRANIFSANIENANIGTVAITSLSVTSLTVPVLNASFANVTTLSVTGTSQHIAVVATLVTTTNANVGLLNASTANITQITFGTTNTSVSNTTTANAVVFNAGFANIISSNIASINAAYANIVSSDILAANLAWVNVVNSFIATLNATSANLTRCNVAANPTANLEVSTKNYVDTGAGGNLVNKITYVAKGDLIPGTGANTFGVLSAGSNGQALVVDTQTATSLRYAARPTQTFRGLSLATSAKDKIANGTQLVVHKLDEVVMDDGEVVTDWTPGTVIDLSVSGAGGLDGGTANANNWYEVYAIRKRSDGTKNFIIHRALDRRPDQNTMNGTQWATGTYGSVGANSTVALANLKVAMSFTPNVSGPVTSIEIRGFKTSTPTGNVWLTLESNTATNPSGTALATSRKYDVARVQLTTHYPIRFVFDTTANVVAGTSYFWVFNSDYVASATAFMNVSYSTQAANGNGGINPGVPKGNNGTAWVDLTPGVGAFIYKVYIESNSVAVTMPTGYDQKCLISYAATDSTSKIKEYMQRDRKIMCPLTAQWMGYAFVGTEKEVMDFGATVTVPPIICDVQFIVIGGGSPQGMSLGRLYALDLPTGGTLAEQQQGVWMTTSSGGTTNVPTPTVWMEQQALNGRSQVAAYKVYPSIITF